MTNKKLIPAPHFAIQMDGTIKVWCEHANSWRAICKICSKEAVELLEKKIFMPEKKGGL